MKWQDGLLSTAVCSLVTTVLMEYILMQVKTKLEEQVSTTCELLQLYVALALLTLMKTN